MNKGLKKLYEYEGKVIEGRCTWGITDNLEEAKQKEYYRLANLNDLNNGLMGDMIFEGKVEIEEGIYLYSGKEIYLDAELIDIEGYKKVG